MKAVDVMISNVATVTPYTTVKDAAKLLASKRISAVPVLDAGRKLVGMLNEGDLIRRIEVGTERYRSWWRETFTSNDKLIMDYVKSHADLVGDIMTRNVITAKEDTQLADIATLFERHHIKRVPIVRDERLVGIVTRADLIRLLAELYEKADSEADFADDQTIRNAILDRLNAEPWSGAALINVSVEDHIVEISGLVVSEAQKHAIRALAESTPGVHGVKVNMELQPVATAM